jgi:hypothetical protein
VTAVAVEDLHMRFQHLLEEADGPESLDWCRKALEERMARLSIARAESLRDGDWVEVTEGFLAGRAGRVVAHCCRARGSLYVELDDLDLGLPIPLPSRALRPVGR